jgi:hypothetical protein
VRTGLGASEGDGRLSDAMTQVSRDEEAVFHARRTRKAGELSWAHLEAEYTQDPETIADSLATGVPLQWCLARPDEVAGGAYRWTNAVNRAEIKDQYEDLRQIFHIKGWEAIVEIRTGWYDMMHGISTLYFPATDITRNAETVVLFPVGEDGILGELQTGVAGRLADARVPWDDDPLPHRRRAALAENVAYVQSLRDGDAKAVAAAHDGDAALAIRNYLTDESSLLDIHGSADIETYFTELFQKYRVLDIEMVNRSIETWYVFADLHWVVEERGGQRRTLEFCTAEIAPLDPDRKYMIRTGSGTDPVQV